MGLALRYNSKWWYGRYKHHGKEVVTNLRVEVRGSRPKRLADVGSVQFENSRGEAQAAFERLMKEIEAQKTEVQLAEAVYVARTGKRLERVRVGELARLWEEIPRKRVPSEKHRSDCVGSLNRFVEFVENADKGVVFVDQLRTEHVKAFLGSLDAEGLTAARWNKYLGRIKLVLRRCGVSAADDFVERETVELFREPYTVEELSAIFKAAWESDRLIYSLAVTAACTAMRKKDCCFLKWADVDFEAGFISVKTSKTGVTVDIPLAELLCDELVRHQGEDSVFVFPEARRQYIAGDSVLSNRFKVVLRLAGFGSGSVAVRCTDDFDPTELEQVAERMCCGAKRERVLAVLGKYLSGMSVKRVAEMVGLGVATVSAYLNEIEAESGVRFIRGKARVVDLPKGFRGELTRPREHGLRAASVRDFHSFRTTFVTLALSNGMPIETVQLITGHRTAEVVLKHYFRPQRETIRAAMEKTMPGLLSVGNGKLESGDLRLEKAMELLRGQTAENWAAVRDEVLAVLEK